MLEAPQRFQSFGCRRRESEHRTGQRRYHSRLPQGQQCCKRANIDCERILLDAFVRIAREPLPGSACICDVEIQRERRRTMVKMYDREHDCKHHRWAQPSDFDKRLAHMKSCRRMLGKFPCQDLLLYVFERATFVRQNDGVQRARAVDSTQVNTADRGLRLQPFVTRSAELRLPFRHI